jgi:uncharacterized protein (DUF1697 family)
MKTYIAFLRGINVSGQKKIKMADLRASLGKVGFENVQTYIQSGNVLVDSEETITSISEMIRRVILKDFGFDVPVLVTHKENMERIIKEYPFRKAEEKNQYFVLLHDKADKALLDDFNKLEFSTEDFLISEDCVYLNCKQGAGKAKLSNNLIERKLKVTATTRNLRTMRKMLELSS